MIVVCEYAVTVCFAGLTTTDHRVIVEEEPVGPFFVLYIAVGVFIAVLLVAVLLMLVCMVLCIRRAQHARLYKNRRPSQRSDVVVQSFTNRAQIDSRRNSQHSSAVDELEFPREKLVILDKVLGEFSCVARTHNTCTRNRHGKKAHARLCI